jgi:hypothetical protein
MNKVFTVLISLCILTLLVVTAEAFTAKSLTITLAPNGDAEMNMQYELSFFEQGAVFFQIADPSRELKKAFDSNSPEPVTVLEATPSSAIILVHDDNPHGFLRESPKDHERILVCTAGFT